jgi:gas vesicle protein
VLLIERKEPNGRVGAFLLGSGMGEMALAVRLLITPQSGEETRANIKSSVLDLREPAEQGLARGRTLVETIASDIRSVLAEGLD